MNFNFEEFHKSNQSLNDLDNIRVKNFKKFYTIKLIQNF